MKIKGEKLKNGTKCVLFLLLVAVTFIMTTYLFRSVDPLARENILLFYEEEPETLDVVVVGSSAAYRYFSPMDAWEQYGFASYNYCTPAMPAVTILSVIKDIEKHQTPEVIVLDVRCFLPDRMHQKFDFRVRNVLDVWDEGPDRMKAIKYVADAYNIGWQDALSEYIDLMQYHDNYSIVLDKDQWKAIDNRIQADEHPDVNFKGYYISTAHLYLEQSEENTSGMVAELPELQVRLYKEVLEYCREKGINLFLTISPYSYPEEEGGQINALEQIAKEYGVLFLDGNKYINEMGLSYADDFYDERHVNVAGAKKYTEFIMRNLCENFDLPDHRGDPKYASWNELDEIYAEKIQKARKSVQNTAERQSNFFALEEEMKHMDSAEDWLWAAKEKKLTLFIFKADTMDASSGTKLILDSFGIGESELLSDETHMYLYSAQLLYGSEGEKEIELDAGSGLAEHKFMLRCEDSFEIIREDVVIKQIPAEKIYIAAYDNIRGDFFDEVYLDVDENGELVLTR